MKKLFAIACMVLMSTAMFGQSKFAVGVNAGFAGFGDDYNPFGLGAKAQYEFVENIRAELDGALWFKKHGTGYWNMDLNFQYLFPVADGIRVYPLVGACLLDSWGDGDMDMRIGFNAGAGVEYMLGENLKLNLDAKYMYTKKDSYKIDAPVIALGVAYCF